MIEDVEMARSLSGIEDRGKVIALEVDLGGGGSNFGEDAPVFGCGHFVEARGIDVAKADLAQGFLGQDGIVTQVVEGGRPSPRACCR